MADQTKKPARRGLAAIVGAAVVAAFTPTQEGRVLQTYRNIGGVLTHCDGATENAQAGKVYTPAECDVQLDHDLDGAARCRDRRMRRHGQAH